MAETRDHYLLVPSEGSNAMLIAGSLERPALPHAAGRPGAAGALEAARELSLEAPYLRCAGLVRDQDGKPIAALHELDAPKSASILPEGLSWLALDDADPATLALPELARHVEGWLARLRGAPVSQLRPPWARSGWHEAAATWARESAEAAGLEPRGDVETLQQWPLSSVLRLTTDAGHVFFKAVFSIFLHEPAVTVALSERHQELVTEVLAVDEEHGWMLMRELPGEPLGDQDVRHWADGLRAMSRIHRSWVGLTEELAALGVPDRTLAALAHDVAGVGDVLDLGPELRERLDSALPDLECLCTALAAGLLPETLIHGDLHPWNAMRNGVDVRIFDWSDASIAHPLFDLATFLPRTEDTSARALMLDAYLETWTDVAPLEELRALAALSAPLAQVHHAISYVRILDALEPDDRWYFADVPNEYVVAALDLLEELRLAGSI